MEPIPIPLVPQSNLIVVILEAVVPWYLEPLKRYDSSVLRLLSIALNITMVSTSAILAVINDLSVVDEQAVIIG